MGCCGQRRAATVAALQASSNARSTSPIRQRPSEATALALRYVGARPVRARGTATGRLYAFERQGAVSTVDTRDVAALVRTGLFVLG
jgi:hypothetical protein